MTKLFKSINISLAAAIIMILVTALNLAEEVKLTTVMSGMVGNEVRGAFGVIGNPPGGSWEGVWGWQTYNPPGNDWLVVGKGLRVRYSNPQSEYFSVDGTALITDRVTLQGGLNVTYDVNIGEDLSVGGGITTSGTISGDRIWMSNDLLFANSNPGGRVDWNGAVYWWGNSDMIHADYVFEPDYKLETVEKHAKFMWKEKRLPAIPLPEKTNNGRYGIEIGGQQRGILAELEKAHIYIVQLKEMIYKLKKRVTRLENND